MKTRHLVVALSSLSMLVACASQHNERQVGKPEREISNSVRSVPAKPAVRPTIKREFETVLVGRSLRSFQWTSPSNITSTQRLPVVVLLHGNDGFSDPISEITDPKGGFDTFAEQQGFIAIYPKSSGSWNHGSAPSPNRDDDVSFIIEAVKIVARQRNIDGRRVFIAGFSEGGMMAQRVVCDTPGGFAGLAVVAASLSRSLAENCKNGNSVPAIFVFGTSDPMIDFGGGWFSSIVLGELLSVDASVNFWVNKNNAVFQTRRALPDLDSRDNTTTTVENYQNRGRNMVQFYKVAGGGHTWPGGTQYAPLRSVGNVARDFSANQAIWDFFMAR
jgi:polyhydroxybutyrate depolymerase